MNIKRISAGRPELPTLNKYPSLIGLANVNAGDVGRLDLGVSHEGSFVSQAYL